MPTFSTWLAAARRPWLALAAVRLYLLRWVQYAAEAAADRARPTPGGAGDALNWRRPELAPAAVALLPGAGRVGGVAVPTAMIGK